MTRYVKHHAARLLVYLGYEKMLKNKVYLFDLLEESLNACPNLSAVGTNVSGPTNESNLSSNVQPSNLSTADKSAAASIGNSSQPNSEPLASGEEDTYIARASFAPICAFTWPKQALNAVSIEGVVLTLLQQIEHHINLGETDDEILNLVRESADRELIDRLMNEPTATLLLQSTGQDDPQSTSAAIGSETSGLKSNVAGSSSIGKASQVDLNFGVSVAQALQAQAVLEGVGSTTTASIPPAPPAIQVDFISSARSSPRKSLPTSTSADAGGPSGLGMDDFTGRAGCGMKCGAYSNHCGHLPSCLHVQRLYLRVFPVVVSPLIVLRLLQHRLFGCLNNYWQWQQPDGSGGGYAANGMPAQVGGYNSRSSFASTCGVESFQGSQGRSRASSATANSFVLPPEFESIGK